jgi:hypothetical protein
VKKTKIDSEIEKKTVENEFWGLVIFFGAGVILVLTVRYRYVS